MCVCVCVCVITDLLSKIALKEVTLQDLTSHLTEHVERIDTDMVSTMTDTHTHTHTHTVS